MALKSKEWFYKQCLRHVKLYSPLAHLCWDILEKGIGQKDSTRGHVTQAIGAAQGFLEEYPQYRVIVRSSDPTRPFDITSHHTMLRDLKAWLRAKSGRYGRSSFGYDYDTLKRILTRRLGGRTVSGGGGDDEFRRVLRLIVEFGDEI